MQRSLVLFDGPIGAGKTSLGRAVAKELAFGFIDGDDHSAPGPWIRSILRTSRKIASATEEALQSHPSVIVSYPLRCTTWIFFQQTFERRGIGCHCVGLIADISAISARDRVFSAQELARSEEMIAQGYGQRPFSDLVIRTDDADFDGTSMRLIEGLRQSLRVC